MSGEKRKGCGKPSVRALEESAWRDAWPQSERPGWKDATEPDLEQAGTLSDDMFCLRAVETARAMDQTVARQAHEAVGDAAWRHHGSDIRKRRSRETLVFKNRFTPLAKEQDDVTEDEETISALENGMIDCQLKIHPDPHVTARKFPQRWQRWISSGNSQKEKE